MNKKKYIKPEMKIVNVEEETELLCASSDNPYWSGCWGEPEHDEDENPYWHGGWGN